MKILILSVNGAGHINCCVGIGKVLYKFGHEIVFGVADSCSWLVDAFDFCSVELFRDPDLEEGKSIQQKWAEEMAEFCAVFRKTGEEQFNQMDHDVLIHFSQIVKNTDHLYAGVIEKVNPDMILIDCYVRVPSVETCGIPWAVINSSNSLRIYDGLPGAPPKYGGFALDQDQSVYDELYRVREKSIHDLNREYDEWLRSKGCSKRCSSSTGKYEIFSPYLNIYIYPSDLDYTEFGKTPEGWFRADHAIRPIDNSPIGVDLDEFIQPGDKLIYFSLGSMASADLELMQRMIDIVKKSPHKFIISKGPLHEKIELPPNMIGGKYLNQLKILSKVDLVITHGGNNSFVEALYHGKPLIVIPLFGDQHDNGRRTEDKKIGRCFHPFKVTESELLNAIDQLLNDQELRKRVEAIGQRIRDSNYGENLSKKLESIVKDQIKVEV
ncbi:putative UDP-glucosyltransferase YojK [Brevipalpus obovatus]|uniref:putative UDP-glucosyltransferase YojK n=1 Tax=Brevipalpus obovatus TaxID=246614 RepID=UPI003D9EA385